ncbi:MAG: hypothetical protein L0Y64_17355, partial [Myxococcaceae bacterium]|nr:hypothetical protein [Myxococcaceae bacterium]
RQAVLARMDAWWHAFARQAPRLDALFSGREHWDLAAWVREHLDPVHPALLWEFGPVPGGGHRLVLTHGSELHLRPLLDVLLARAPALPGWELHGWRQPEEPGLALRSVNARTGVDFSGYHARVTCNTDGTVDITYSPRSRSPWRHGRRRPSDAALEATAVGVTESLLGEELLETRVGTLIVEERGEGMPLGALAREVGVRLEELDARLPEEPFHARGEGAGWTHFELKPIQALDYPARMDLFVASTLAPELWTSAHAPRPFSSRRFSRHGETFCYLKLEGSGGFGHGGLKDRSDVERALDAVLIPNRLGRVIGGGAGLRYAYVDLALADVERAMAVMRDVLQREGAPRRSWLLFWDSTLGAEWIPVWEDAPAPPLPQEA